MNNFDSVKITKKLGQKLIQQGWASVMLNTSNPKCLGQQLLELGSMLGAPQPTRGKTLVDRLTPQNERQAHPKSLSALTGLSEQPWHVDLAHRQLPARYILLACEKEGSNTVPTELAYWESLLDENDYEYAHTEPFLVRNGSSSFYATILTLDEKFFRFDPGCMQPMTGGGELLMNKLCNRKIAPVYSIDWKQGQAVIIDNWRMLHRRSNAHGAQDRILLRVSVAGGNNK